MANHIHETKKVERKRFHGVSKIGHELLKIMENHFAKDDATFRIGKKLGRWHEAN